MHTCPPIVWHRSATMLKGTANTCGGDKLTKDRPSAHTLHGPLLCVNARLCMTPFTILAGLAKDSDWERYVSLRSLSSAVSVVYH